MRAHENIKSVNEERKNDLEEQNKFHKGLLTTYKKEL